MTRNTLDEKANPGGGELAPGSAKVINDKRYADIAAIVRSARASAVPGDRTARAEAEPVLFLEARLLDQRRYREWLPLLSSDYAYWIPGSADIEDPRIESAVNFDDRRRMIDRVALIETGSLHAQIPPSRACRIITNVEAWVVDEGRILARSNLVICEYRRGHTTMFTGSQLHELTVSGNSWAIRTRVVNLLDCDEPQGNVTFIL